MTQTTFVQKLSFVLTAFGIVGAPMAFGGTPGWFTPALAIYAGILALLLAIDTAFGHPFFKPPPRLFVGLIVLYLAVAIWCLLQAVPVFPGELVHETWYAAAEYTETKVQGSISVNPEESLRGSLRLLAYGIVFLCFYRLGADEGRAFRSLAIIVLSGALYAAYGLVSYLSAVETVLWYPRTFEDGNLSSTFPNRNAFASYAALCLLGACALLYRRRIRLSDLSGHGSLKIIVAARYLLPRNWWIFTTAGVLFTAILLTHSRGGLLVAFAAIAVFIFCAARTARFGRIARASGACILATGILAAVVGGTDTAKRFSTLSSAAVERIEIYDLTIDAISDRPILGTGLGTFSDIFPAYRTPSLRPNIEFAHNSYLENALEMGVPAAFTFYTALAGLFGLLVFALIAKRSGYPYPALGVATMTAIALHATFDYSIQFPAVALTACALLGIAAAQSFVSSHENATERPFDEDRRASRE